MTAKQVIPAASQGPATLVDSLQSEVSSEASPLLEFLVNNARFIVLLLVLFLAVIVGYWVYSNQADKQTQADLRSLGEILVLSDPAKRLERLEAYAPSAPSTVQRQAWFSIMETATLLKKHDTTYTAWEKISTFGGNIKATAVMGMASSLAEQGKMQEAVDLLSARLGEFTGQDALNVNLRIVSLAEAAGDIKRALAACDVIIASPESKAEGQLWHQKRAALAELDAAANTTTPAAAPDAPTAAPAAAPAAPAAADN